MFEGTTDGVRFSIAFEKVNTLPAPAVVSQFYVTEAENEYVIRANSAIMKCKIPSFVSEFIHVDQWVADDGTIYTAGQEYGMTPVDTDVVCVVVSAGRSFCSLLSPYSHLPPSSSHFLLARPSPTVGCSSHGRYGAPTFTFGSVLNLMQSRARNEKSLYLCVTCPREINVSNRSASVALKTVKQC